MTEPVRSIQLAFARLDVYPTFVNSVFLDGSDYGAFPHHTKAYSDLAERCGYGQDIFAYCVFHEFSHHWVAEKVYAAPSRVIWALAHGKMAPREAVLHEESLAILFQMWMQGDMIMPATASGVDWFAIKSDAIAVWEGALGKPWSEIRKMDGSWLGSARQEQQAEVELPVRMREVA